MTRSRRTTVATVLATLALAAPLAACSGDSDISDTTTAAAAVAPSPSAGTADEPASAADGTCERPQASEAPEDRGSVAYNEWLGETFTAVLLNTTEQEERVDILEQIVAEDYIQHNPLLAEGRQGLIDFLPVIYQAFPDACFVLRDAFATEERVVTRWTWTGTLTGAAFLGVEPAGQQVEFDAIDIWTVRDGQLYEHWDQFDWPRAFVQLSDGSADPAIPQPFIDVAGQPVDR